MDTDFVALASFVLITNFTPGPNNISGASMGILYGYKSTLRYLLGIGTGFFLMMLLCGWISSTLLQVFPVFESILRIIGAIYILWLAYHTFRASYTFDEDQQLLLGFSKGFFLQLLNPKVIVYGLTIYSTFLGEAVAKHSFLLVSALVLAGIGFSAVTTWTLFGAAIRIYLGRPRIKQILNSALSILLVYSAVELSGVLDLLFA
jgi:cysteine/O-acetylserine efflux protein